MNTERIIFIEVERIEAHPDNPRRSLGDLTELVESIKKSGILQNLTVIPHPEDSNKYRALIGHRRLGAAKEAGLTSVPCVVMEGLSHADQVAIMMAENVQRQNLTLAEEVQGIQLMLELGESVESISDKTGLGKSTIYKRRKLGELDREAFEKSVERGATLADYEKLNEIESEELRKKCLDAIGTKNFDAVVSSAKSEEKRKKEMDKLIADISTWAKEVDITPPDMDYYRYLYTTSPETHRSRPTDKQYEGRDFLFRADTWGVYIYMTKKQPTAEDEANAKVMQEKAEKRNARNARIAELDERMYELRKDYIMSVTPATAEKKIYEIALFILMVLFYRYAEFNTEFISLLGIELTEDEEDYVDWPNNSNESKAFCDELFKDICKTPKATLHALWLYAYALINDSERESCWETWSQEYKTNDDMVCLYDLMSLIGYEKSDEEQQWLDGTHPMYQPEEENEQG